MSLAGVGLAAYQEIRANSGRTTVTMLGIVIGVAAFTAVVAAGTIATAATSEFIEREFGRPATLQLSFEAAQPDPSQREVFESLLGRTGVPGFAPISAGEAHAVVGPDGEAIAFNLVGTTPSLADIRHLDLLAGRWLSSVDRVRLGPVLVVNEALLAAMAVPRQEALETMVGLTGAELVTARIVGVVGDGLTDTNQPSAYIPIEALAAWRLHEGPTGYLIRVNPADQGVFIRALERTTSRWDIGTPAVYRIDTAGNYTAIVDQQRLVLTVVAAVALMIGGLSLLNMGLVTARQRVQEFGIRRSFGATGTEIFVMVIAESLVTSLVAGGIGVAAAVGLTRLLPGIVIGNLPSVPLPPFPLTAAIAGVVVSALVGLVAGFLPASRATRQPTILAVRG